VIRYRLNLAGVAAASLLLAACADAPKQSASAPAAPATPAGSGERYDRDRAQCRVQVDEYMKTRRNIDDSRREVYAGNYDRYGQGDLPRDMANYGDTRTSDRMISSCMESRGWAQPSRGWFPNLGL